MHALLSAEAGRRPSSLAANTLGRKGVKGGQADATVAGIRSGSRPIRGPDENNTGVGSRANHAAHAFSGVVEEGPPPSAQWLGSSSSQAQQTAPSRGVVMLQAGLRIFRLSLDECSRVESSHRMTSLDTAWEPLHRFVSPLIAGRLHPHLARKHWTQSVESSAVNLWFLWLLPLPSEPVPTLHPAPPCTLVLHSISISISLQAATQPIWDPPTWIVPRLSPDPIQPARLAFFTIASPQLPPAPIARRRPCLGCECRHGWCLFLYIKRQFPPFFQCPSPPPPRPSLDLTRRSRPSIDAWGCQLRFATCHACAGTDRPSTML